MWKGKLFFSVVVILKFQLYFNKLQFDNCNLLILLFNWCIGETHLFSNGQTVGEKLDVRTSQLLPKCCKRYFNFTYSLAEKDYNKHELGVPWYLWIPWSIVTPVYISVLQLSEWMLESVSLVGASRLFAGVLRF